MSKTLCKDCIFFRQHYTLSEHKLIKVNCGHCAHIKTKKCTPDARCGNYTPGPKATDAFVTRAYLTKTLLHHVLDMELLPPIVTDDKLNHNE